jgi:DNA/RNA-binding domain of Phe-tRNA-synthetase-like protein
MFAYDPAVTERFPAIRAGVVGAVDLVNGPSPAELVDQYRAEQAAALKRLEETPISEMPSIRAWRRAFSAFGVKPTQHRVAAEALLRRLQKAGGIPSINTLVDIGNLVSIRYAVPVAVFDQSGLTGSLSVRFATGTERFTDLGSTEEQHPEPGEVIFVDQNDDVCARRWCWRQSAQSATRAETTAALITIEALHDDAESDVEVAASELESLLELYQGQCRYTGQILSDSNPTATLHPYWISTGHTSSS